jgi:transposase
MIAPAYSRAASEEAVFWRSCAQLLEAENARLAAQNATLAGTVAAQREQLAALKQRVVTLSRMLFGSSNEKSGPGKPETGGDGLAAGGGDDGPGDGGRAGSGRRGQRPGSAGHGRRRHEHLEAEERVHDLPGDQRCCPQCGRPYAPMGEDVSEQLSWRVRVWRVVHRRRKYARRCRCPMPAVRAAPAPPRLTARGLFSVEFCVNLLIAKFALGLPFNRVIAMLSFQGLELAPGTLAGVAQRLDGLLAPLAAAIAARWPSVNVRGAVAGRIPHSSTIATYLRDTPPRTGHHRGDGVRGLRPVGGLRADKHEIEATDTSRSATGPGSQHGVRPPSEPDVPDFRGIRLSSAHRVRRARRPAWMSSWQFTNYLQRGAASRISRTSPSC